PAPVSFRDSKTQRAKCRREIGRVQSMLGRLASRQNAVIEEILEHEQPGHVCFSFFDRAVNFFQLKPYGCGPPIHTNLMRANAMTQLMSQDMCKEGVEVDIGARGGRQHNS